MFSVSLNRNIFSLNIERNIMEYFQVSDWQNSNSITIPEQTFILFQILIENHDFNVFFIFSFRQI